LIDEIEQTDAPNDTSAAIEVAQVAMHHGLLQTAEKWSDFATTLYRPNKTPPDLLWLQADIAWLSERFASAAMRYGKLMEFPAGMAMKALCEVCLCLERGPGEDLRYLDMRLEEAASTGAGMHFIAFATEALPLAWQRRNEEQTLTILRQSLGDEPADVAYLRAAAALGSERNPTDILLVSHRPPQELPGARAEYEEAAQRARVIVRVIQRAKLIWDRPPESGTRLVKAPASKSDVGYLGSYRTQRAA